MKRFSPDAIIKAGYAALTNKHSLHLRKRIKTEALKPYSDFNGNQVALHLQCSTNTYAVTRHMKVAISQAKVFLQNQENMLMVAEATVNAYRDEVTLQTARDGYADVCLQEQLGVAEETVRQLKALKAHP